ncbi:MAG: hypothetical protein AB9846_17740 [Tenuifilaceae bacterium]
MRRILCFILIPTFFACDDGSEECNCPPYDIVPDSPYNDPVWHPSDSIIGFNHKPIKEIQYLYGYDCPHQAIYIYDEDSVGFWLINSDGTNKRRILPYTLLTPTWSPDGKWIAFSNGAQICIMPFDGKGFDTTAIVQLTFGGSNFFPSWSPDGEWIAFDSNLGSTTGLNFIWKMTKNGLSKKRIAFTPSDGETRMPCWGNDFTIVHQRYIGIGSPEIFKMDSTGNNVIRLTYNAESEKNPKYSPNEATIAFNSSVSSGGVQLYTINSDGSGIKKLPTDGCESFSWSPKGEIVYLNYDYYRIDENRGTLWIMDKNGNGKRQLTFNKFKVVQ